MSDLSLALLLSLAAGGTIPLGAWIAARERIAPRWLEREFRHTVMAFGGGALLAAVALVLVPEGVRALDPITATGCFLSGGVAFMGIDRALARRAGPSAQLMAMLLDFVPEATALGATLVDGGSVGYLLAFLIGLQNLPEGFNAFRELHQAQRSKDR